jgi:hypothetical protein
MTSMIGGGGGGGTRSGDSWLQKEEGIIGEDYVINKGEQIQNHPQRYEKLVPYYSHSAKNNEKFVSKDDVVLVNG